MTPKEKAYQIAQNKMYNHDAFSQWLGIQILDLDAGAALLQMTIREEMTNGFGIAHGGIIYSLADTALAFAANSHGRHSLSVETSISHLLPVRLGDTIQATTTQESLSHKIAVYSIVLSNQKQEKVGIFKGTVYRSSKEWDCN